MRIRSFAVATKDGGFSLVEVALGMAILGVAATALLSAYATGIFMMRMTRENLRATQVMLEKVETIRLYSWENVTTPGFIPTNFTAKYDPRAVTGSQGLTYDGTMILSPAPMATSYSNDVKQVVVHVKWKTGGVQRDRELVTYIARNGIQDYVY